MYSETGKDREWIKAIDSSLIDLYPIQFANCDRLQKNDAVYIFDEVGSGKTISSGLMALDYLTNNPEKSVCIITTNALAKKGSMFEYGQFLKDWYDKLPFFVLGLDKRIEVVNNYYSNIRKINNCGLIIVDEAQLFLNTESLRYRELSKKKAEKVVFLTATPIKTNEGDLYTYVSLAKQITGKNDLDQKWIEEINTNGKNVDSIICSKFDVEYPVTRYFKDTIMSINEEGTFEKKQARRLIPQLWEYGWSKCSKNDIMLQKINECLKKTDGSRFVVFTRFVDKEAVAIGEFLRSKGFCPFDNNNSDGLKSYKVVTGENSYELANFSGIANLPTVLILTYQIAEQGVNLPGYNHVINYHISAFPSSLEQRFGRIDRMGKNGSAFSEINMCFLVSSDYWDTNTWNFWCAMTVYMRNLLSYLPSKNTILTEDILEKYMEKKDYVEKYIDSIKELLESEQQINCLLDYFERIANNEEDRDVVNECDKNLIAFLDENGIKMDIELDREDSIKFFKISVANTLAEYKSIFDSANELSTERLKEIIRQLGDKVFYQSEGIVKTIDAIDCGEKIAENELFKQYKDEFVKRVQLPLVVFKYNEKINRFFENKFIDNDFSDLFPYGGYSNVFQKIFEADEIDEDEKQLLVDNSDSVVNAIPFYRMCKQFENVIQGMEWSMRWGKVAYDFNQFQSAFYQIYRIVRQSENRLGLSECFFDEYFAESEEVVEWYDKCYGKHYGSSIFVRSSKYFDIEREDGVLQATNWYKLAYQYTRKEAWYKRDGEWHSGGKNIYCRKEMHIDFLVKYYDSYKNAIKFINEYDRKSTDKESIGMVTSKETVSVAELELQKYKDIVYHYEKLEQNFKKIICAIEKRKGDQSLFSFYYFTERGYLRKYSFDKPHIKDGKVFIKDIWTQGIIYELFRVRYEKCTIGNICKSPEFLKDIHICY